MTLSKKQFKDLHSQMMATPGEEGGFTVHAQTGEVPTTGTMVSYPDTETLTSPASASRPSDIPHYVNQNRESLSQSDTYLGGWKPKSDEFTTLDRSQRFEGKPAIAKRYGQNVADADATGSALDMGISRNQFAVFDLKRGRSIDTGIDRSL